LLVIFPTADDLPTNNLPTSGFQNCRDIH